MGKILSSLVFLALIPSVALAQITPDSSLGEEEKSVVNTNGNRDTINGGAVRNANLFHSFQEFNVGTGREAYFSNPDGIDNIFSRVTGNNFSDIQGVLGVLGNANLYLINPNGILFGENARLDVNGSFFATTADSVLFDNGFEFSAANPNAPPLLTIDIPIGLKFRDNSGDIVNRGSFQQVPAGETLALIAGNVSVENGGIIFAPGGRVELGSLIETGTIGIAEDSSLIFPDGIARGDISVTNSSTVAVFSGGGGSIEVNARYFNLTNGSSLIGGILINQSSVDAQAGDISINATEIVSLDGQGISTTGIFDVVLENLTGNAGNINITTKNLFLSNGAKISATNGGQGNAGSISIGASETTLLDGQETGLLTNASDAEAIGNGGDIDLTTGSLTVRNGAFFNAGTLGEGNAGSINISGNFLTLSNRARLSTRNLGQGKGGNVTINVTEDVSLTNSSGIIVTGGEGGGISLNAQNLFIIKDSFLFAGINTDSGFPGAQSEDIVINLTEDLVLDGLDGESITFISNNNFGTGNAGSIDIFARNITFNNGGNVSGNNNGQGSIGNINLTATGDIIFDGSKGDQRSGVVNFVNEQGRGNVGEIKITAQNLSLTEGAQIQSLVAGTGNSGDIELSIVDTIQVDGFGEFVLEDGTKSFLSSAISSNVAVDAEGNSGDIDINTRKLFLSDGGQIDTNIFGIGNAGNIDITAKENIKLDGKNRQGVLLGGISSTVNPGAVGNGGNIQIFTQNFSMFNNANINAATGGEGNGGQINITATNLDLIDGSDITASTFGMNANNVTQGNAGNITINVTDTLNINGTSTINFQGQVIESPAGIFASNGGNRIGDAGNIDIKANKLFLSNGSQINSFTRGKGDAGTININVPKNVFLDGENELGVLTGISTNVTGGGVGNAGEINLKTSNLTLMNGAQITSGTFGRGNGGNVNINAIDTVSLDGESSDGVVSIISSSVVSGAVGDAGAVSIETKKLTLTNGAEIQSATSGEGDAGNVRINATDTVSLDGEDKNGSSSKIDSSIQPNAVGKGGEVRIDTTNLSLTNGAQISSSTFGTGNAGSIVINATDTIFLDGEGRNSDNSIIASSVNFGAVGKGGEIRIDTTNLSLTNGAQIIGNTSGMGNAGNIILNVVDRISLDGEDRAGVDSGITNSVEAGAIGNGGEILIDTNYLTLTNGAFIDNNTSGRGNAGSITIEAIDTISLDGQGKDGIISEISSSVASEAIGNAGEILIETSNLSLTNKAVIRSSTFGEGNAKGVTVNSTNLSVTNGAQIASTTSSQGEAGSVIVRVRDSIELSGISAGGRSGLFVNATQGNGDGGNIEVFTNELIVLDGATISASNFQSLELAEPGTGEAGNVKIEANSILLENGQINTATQAGNDGNITLKVAEDIILRDNSLISARAFKEATGGNIDIDARFIVAFPEQNNDIIASASQGQGGKINLTTEGLFGLEERSSTPPNKTNDIDASSEFGLSGTVNITQPTVDPASGLLDLTQEVVDPAKLIAQNVCTQTANSEFIDIGKGGLPKNPEYVLAEDALEVGLVAPIITSSEVTESTKERREVKPRTTRKPPAQGWIWHENGMVELVAYNPNEVGEQRTWDKHRGCQN